MEKYELQRFLPEAPDSLCEILDGKRGVVEQPIRSELFGIQRFLQHGHSLALTHESIVTNDRPTVFFPRLSSNILVLEEAQRYIGEQAISGYDLSPAAEWLLDNFHVIQAQLKEIHEGLPRSYFRSLPVLLDEPLAGLPRVYGVAWAFVAHTDGAFDEELLCHFLTAYQEKKELNLSEIWALPTTLRVVLIENLRRLAERVATNKAAREVANLCCDHIENFSLAALDQLLALLNQRGVGKMFLSQMAQRLQNSQSIENESYNAWIQSVLPDLAAIQMQRPADQAADNLSMRNAITALRAIGDADWTDIVARTSTLMRLMLTSAVFEAEDTSTRNQSLHGIELLAKRSGKTELVVAQTLLNIIHKSSQGFGSKAAQEASYWLGGAGKSEFMLALGMQVHDSLLWRFVQRYLPFPGYLIAILLGTIALVAWVQNSHGAGQISAATPLWVTVVGILIMAFPASEAVLTIINRLISESVRPKHLPRLAFVKGIPPEHRVMVVVPAMLSNEYAIQDLAHRLQLHYLANPEKHAQFAMLTDWVDADTQSLASDEALLRLACAQVDQLNARYPIVDENLTNEAPRFIVLHRKRSFSETEQRWIGWERKRGKLEMLVETLAIAKGRVSSMLFIDLGELSRIADDIKYVVTLDSDTQLPPGRLRDLVGTAAHPHNQPIFDRERRTIVSGYGILQPRVATPLPSTKQLTLYHWLFAGQCGIDPYSVASSEVYQDMFGEGTFTGKGLLNVQAVHAVLCGRLPEGQVLSHDLLEGSLVRCAAVTDISVIEDAPFHADVAASRVHRWTRGDWQLLPLLFNPSRFPLRAINRWKILDNLRRSLVVPMSLILLLMALSGVGVSPWAALALVFASFTAGPIMGAVAGLSPSRDDIAKLFFFRAACIDLLRAMLGGIWHVGQLLQQAMLALDAIGRALYRTNISRLYLLQWTTAATVQATAKANLIDLLRLHWKEPVSALVLMLCFLVLKTPFPVLSVVICLIWAASPIGIWWVSRSCFKFEKTTLSDADQSYLAGIARDTWRFFERCVVPEENHLPPDNLQTTPHDMVAHRTSPTNIGLYLLSVVCARQFGWISTQEVIQRLQLTLGTMNKLERYRGHFLNWYDTQTLAPLLQKYVSTVDSGNLSGHLLAVAEACLELSQTSENQNKVLLQSLSHDFKKMAWQADFSFLYHSKRRLLHIGYRVEEHQLDGSFYDLLASESRLTSLLAIAKGDVPVSHWAALARPFYAVGKHAGLRSWSGSMFEYLMPTLVLDEPPSSVLHDACCAALQEQMEFAKEHRVPWGMSESAYAANDETLAYQYSPQGVPRLALRRTPPGDLVVAPYATALAAQIAPNLAIKNFAYLQSMAIRANYGFIEALDFSEFRQTSDKNFITVDTFMAHHQGMSIVAIANVLLDSAPRRWGMANAHIEAVSSLLHERVPREVSILHMPPSASPSQPLPKKALGLLRDVRPGAAAIEPTHVLSNGRYSVTLRSNGAGSSSWGQTNITRWRDDALRDAYGSFFYLRREKPSAFISSARVSEANVSPVSITQHPAPDSDAHYSSIFHADRVCFEAQWSDLQTSTTVWVSPEDDIEFRRVELRNLSKNTITIELISAFEVTLANPLADEAHPAFSNLFLRAEWLAEHQALLFERRPRLATERKLYAAHFLAVTDPQVASLRIQTDRQHWIGRNHVAAQPIASLYTASDDSIENAPTSGMQDESRKSTTLDTGLDPVCVLSVRLRIAPFAKARVTFATTAADNESTLQAVIDKYRQHSHVQRASLMSATLANIRLRSIGISAEKFAAIQTLTTTLVLSLTRPQTRDSFSTAAIRELCDKKLLWRFGISADKPILMVSAAGVHGLGMLRSLVQALRLWFWGGIACDVVVINAEPISYDMPLHREITALYERYIADCGGKAAATGANLHVLRANEITSAELATLQMLARVHLVADGRPFAHQVNEWVELHEQAFTQRSRTSTSVVPLASHASAAPAAPSGSFDDSLNEFKFNVSNQQRPNKPWVNVMANPAFGALLSESGGGYTWAGNSRLNQLTAWSNDPVTDPPAEWFLLQDIKTQEIWNVAPSACGDGGTIYSVSHGQGYSEISHLRGDLSITATWCVDAETSVKQVQISIENLGYRAVALRLLGIVEWKMGANLADRSTTTTAIFRQRLPSLKIENGEQKLTALLCTQRDHSAGFGSGTAFLALANPKSDLDDWTCDRRECFDARGRLVLPDHFGQRSGSALDPCAALSTRIDLKAGAFTETTFLLGYAENVSAAQQLATLAAAQPSQQRLDKIRQQWRQLLGATQVITPDPLFDAMVNRWLLYQTISCRLWAKAGFYQAGGAYGFRDQLQDAMALTWAAPNMLKQQIILAASRQFPEGDVQHWWHAPGGAGVRTHFSDDLLWLPHACVRYLQATGDTALMSQTVPFIEGAAIPDGAEDAYYTPSISAQEASVYEHAARAIDRSLKVGINGLPLMGTGDWNDGMNRVAHEGRGESVWLAWFLCQLVDNFSPLARAQGDQKRALQWEGAATGWKTAISGSAWDGQWFKRAFFDDGSALGSHLNPEARIDLIAQAWSVLSGVALPSLQRMALESVEMNLVDHDAGLIKLLDPPLVHANPSAGYIQAYPPGVRENGGQYSHGAVWALMAQAEFAKSSSILAEYGEHSDLAYRYFTYLSPAHRAIQPTHGAAYGVEPYVMAGDVYTQPPYIGRGGWSWYTGAAAWMHRAAVESIFGLQLGSEYLSFNPCLPSHWPQAELKLLRDGRTMRFILHRSTPADAFKETAQWRAQLLLKRQQLQWTKLVADTCFVIPLLD